MLQFTSVGAYVHEARRTVENDEIMSDWLDLVRVIDNFTILNYNIYGSLVPC